MFVFEQFILVLSEFSTDIVYGVISLVINGPVCMVNQFIYSST